MGTRRIARTDRHDGGALDHRRWVEQPMRGHLGGAEQAEAYGVSCGLRPVPRDAEEAPGHAAQAVGKPEREGGQARGYDARHGRRG